jgi:ketosteroid isomerase-like protein
MTVDERKEMARRFFDVFAAGDLTRLRDLLPPDAVIHQCGFLAPIAGRAVLQGTFRAGRRIRDREVRLERLIGEGDTVALHWRTNGVYVDPASPERDGVRVSFPSMTFVRFENGRIAEIWNIQDTSTLQSQIDEAAASGGAGAA